MRVVVKIGTASLTNDDDRIDDAAVAKLAAEVAAATSTGHEVVVVTSAAITAGLPPLGYANASRPRDPDRIRAASAVGQISLIATYQRHLAEHGLVTGQLLLAPTDFWYRNRYLKSRGTIRALLDLGAVPVINENDAVADDEIRFGDNDRLAALVAHLVEADRLILLTDTPGLFDADPRHNQHASLIEEIVEIDQRLEQMAGGAGSVGARGGMASKLTAAKIATWSGVEAVIADSRRPEVVADAIAGGSGVGSVFRAKAHRLGARKLWIAFALPALGRIVVDAGAREALERRQKSLLAAGVVEVGGSFDAGDAVEVADTAGEVFAKGLMRWTSHQLSSHAGWRTSALPAQLVHEVIHRDDLVLVPS